MRRFLKACARGLSLAAALGPAATCWLEAAVSGGETLFRLWAQSVALLPGLPGDYLRVGFYRLTLAACSPDASIAFLSQFSHRQAEVGSGVYIGVGALIGTATLGEGCMIGSRASIPSGGSQHWFDDRGRLTPSDPRAFRRVRVGAHTWVGEAAVVMADVGSRCVICAGAVVSSPIPDEVVVAGNPARAVARTRADPAN